MPPIFFKSQGEFRRWLRKHHLEATEVWVGMYKVHTGKPSLTWNEAVDEALCFGWIDSVVRRIDAESHMQRFTPRKKSSAWSAKNLKRIGELIDDGRVSAHGLKVFNERDPRKQNLYSAEQETIAFTSGQEKRFRSNRKAWKYFQSQPPYYRRTATWWVVSAKREETRDRRLDALIEASAAGQPAKPFIVRKD